MEHFAGNQSRDNPDRRPDSGTGQLNEIAATIAQSSAIWTGVTGSR